MKTDINYYFPWVRKGLSNRIDEEDTLAENTPGLALERSVLFVEAKFEKTPASAVTNAKDKLPVFTETKQVQFISPGDITGVNSDAIMRVAPKEGSDDFSIQFFPYIEFWEPDFPWRYTPAHPTADGKKLRPWLALLACKKENFSMVRMNDGRQWASMHIETEDQYRAIFPAPEDTWKSAHAQGITNDEPAFSRLLALRQAEELDAGQEYYVLLVPAFETGRLRGLGYDDDEIKNVVAQQPAWEQTLEKQKNRKKPLCFPVYYAWDFKAGGDSFDAMAKKLTIASDLTADIKIDVSRMGEGLDYDLFDDAPERKVIGMPAATKTIGYNYLEESEPFPKKSGDEEKLYENLKNLLSKNPVFLENKMEIAGGDAGEAVGDDDPWIVPPIYGGKHIMAASLDDADHKETPWLPRLNLDIHFRAAAGLGRKTVQTHQEEFVNRAWKQVEAINTLNQEMRKRLLSVNVNDALKNKTFRAAKIVEGTVVRPVRPKTEREILAGMINNLGTMKNARVKIADGKATTSMASLLTENSIPQSFASASFQNLTRDFFEFAGRKLLFLDDQVFKMAPQKIHNIPDLENLKAALDNWARYLYGFANIIFDPGHDFDIPVAGGGPGITIPGDLISQLELLNSIHDQWIGHTGQGMRLDTVSAVVTRSKTTTEITFEEFLERLIDGTPVISVVIGGVLFRFDVEDLWRKLYNFVIQWEAEKAARGELETSTPGAGATAQEVQDGFDDSETWNRMREVAETYYKEFFNSDVQIEKYLDELLLSKFPVMAYPIFPEPAYYYLKMFSDKFILPCADELPDDSVAVFESNEAFTEAYLCGMNTEMGRELLWREYPTDQRGSYFRKFWDSETSAEDVGKNNFFDVKPLHTWKGNLGFNSAESKTGLLLFVIKGKLLRQYPGTQVFLHKAVGKAREINFAANATVANGAIRMPVIQAFLKDDILLMGFNGDMQTLVGVPPLTSEITDSGHFLAFLEDMQDLNFKHPGKKIEGNHAADVAQNLKNEPTLYGRHLSHFINKKKIEKEQI